MLFELAVSLFMAGVVQTVLKRFRVALPISVGPTVGRARHLRVRAPPARSFCFATIFQFMLAHTYIIVAKHPIPELNKEIICKIVNSDLCIRL